MNIIGVLKRLSIKELYVLSVLMLRHPFYIFPTFNATKRTLILCDRYFKNNHHKNGIGNAFRHALWNVLICKKVFKINKNTSKSAIWAQKVTDLHEKLAPNEPLENAMDLHNNKIGRVFFIRLKDTSEADVITSLRNACKNAIKISDITTFEKHKNELVYLSE